ncbi:hypothetical protein O0L34_g13589 [Tuta absoluta]|nr:hypothetical protein O0L34_g13589 [Tuta absoluta]
MKTIIRNEIFFVTIIFHLHFTSSNVLTNIVSNGKDAVENALNFDPTQSILHNVIPDGLQATLEDILKTGPSLKEDLAKLENTDFLQKFKAGEQFEEKRLNITQLIKKNGYNVQTFTVTTEDGYVLTLYRIPGKGHPILLVHGLLNSAVDWFTVGQESALPYLLADRDYDVWVISCRGTTEESQGHVNLTLPKDAHQYWDFSWDEIGRYDLPATIDLVLKETGKSKLIYVGFSQGTTSFYVMASERPKYAEKISLMISLAPAAWISNMKSPILRFLSHVLAPFSGVIRNVIGFDRFNAKNPIVQFITDYICGVSVVATLVCGNVQFSLFGFDYAQVNATQSPVIYGHAPSSASTKQLLHYGQLINSGEFRRYDYGADQNIAVYGSESPPDYPVDNISTPIALFYSRANDWVSDYKDVLILQSHLSNIVEFFKVPFDTWAHLDYLWGKDVKTLVYDRLLELLKD